MWIHVQKAIMKAKTILRNCFTLKLGDDNVSFWFVMWLDSESLCNKVWIVNIHDKELCVRGCWHDGE